MPALLSLVASPGLIFRTIQAKKYGKELIIADREMVESNSEAILEPAKTEDVSFLVVGDSLW
jgi:diphthine synthase